MWLSHIFYGVRQPFSEIPSKANAPQWLMGCRFFWQVNFPRHGDIAGAGRADLQSLAGFGAINNAQRLIFCFGESSE